MRSGGWREPDLLEIAPLVAETVMRRGYQLFGLVPVHRTLEEIFIHLTGRSLDEDDEGEDE